jgi:hypothetical protein
LPLLACTLLLGCGKGDEYEAVSGSVTFRGKALETGSIQFYSSGAPPAPLGGAAIAGGRYELPQNHGLKPGEYWVRISSTELVENPDRVNSLDAPFKAVERIPARYNAESTLTVTVSAGGTSRFDFNLE